MLHKGWMAMATGEAEETRVSAAMPARWLRIAARAMVDYALPPRCPGCGTIVGADRQFCLGCWSSLHFLDGPACLHCSIPLPTGDTDGGAL